MTTLTYVTAAEAARRRGTSTDAIRALAASGAIPGALRIGSKGSPWAIHESWADGLEGAGTPSRPAPEGTGLTTPTRPTTGAVTALDRTRTADLMSLWSEPATAPRPLDVARLVAGDAGAVFTRPARALTETAYGIAALAGRHFAGPDGRCVSCSAPMYPCPDRAELDAILERARSIVVDGER